MDIFEELKEASGMHFQNLFSKLMKQKYRNEYQATCTQGNIGDRKVDGILNSCIAFAVHAPETYQEKKVISKMKSDFYGFLEQKEKGYWSFIKRYIFVIKNQRQGLTPTMWETIHEFEQQFSVGIMTMEDLKILSEGYLPFSADGQLLEELKQDVMEIMEYVIETDFAAEPVYIFLSDDIEQKILSKWWRQKFAFQNKNLEELKQRILKELESIRRYLTPEYMHSIGNQRILFNNDSWEAGERLRNELRPETYKIRCEIKRLLNELYSIKE